MPSRDNSAARLSVYMDQETATALHELTVRKGSTVTEQVRRAVAVLKFVQDAVDNGGQLAVLDRDGNTLTAVTFL